MTAHPRRFYGDPAVAVEFSKRQRDESVRDCVGCANKIFISGEVICVKGRAVLERCRDYEKGNRK